MGCIPARDDLLLQVLGQLAAMHESLRFVKVEAEACPELSERFGVSVVPTFVLLAAGGAADAPVFEKLEGADAPTLAQHVQAFHAAAAAPAPSAAASAAGPAAAGGRSAALDARLARLISTAPAMLFMKVCS